MKDSTPATAFRGPWLIKQPGEHGEKLRVVEDIGLTVEGRQVCAGICEILTSRTSEHGFSDVTEQARARLLRAAPDMLRHCHTAAAILEAIVVCEPNSKEAETWSAVARNIRQTIAEVEGQPPKGKTLVEVFSEEEKQKRRPHEARGSGPSNACFGAL